MHSVYSQVESGKLLHIIYRKIDFERDYERDDLVPPDNFLQVSTLILNKERKFKPHKHIWHKSLYRTVRAQESWIVIDGSVRISLYDVDDTVLCSETLYSGDFSVTIDGGHSYEILEDNTKIVEYKSGPYLGQKKDKKFINFMTTHQ